MDRPSHSSLDDPERAPHAWRRFRRLMRLVAVLAVVADAAALAYVLHGIRHPSVHLVIAILLGVTLTVVIGCGLMLLVFLSDATGHDDEVQQRLDDRGW